MKMFDFMGKQDFDAGVIDKAYNPETKITLLHRQNRILKANLERSFMISHALWEIVRFQCGLTDEDILRKVSEIDLRDGVLDGKNEGTPTICPGCGQRVSTRNPTCPYCGHVIDESIFNVD